MKVGREATHQITEHKITGVTAHPPARVGDGLQSSLIWEAQLENEWRGKLRYYCVEVWYGAYESASNLMKEGRREGACTMGEGEEDPK